MSNYLKSFFIALGLILLVVLYVFEFPYFSNTLQAKNLIISSAIIGILIGIGLGRYFAKSTKDSLERLQVFVFFIFLSALFMPLFGSLSNRLLSYHPIQSEQVELFKREARYVNRFGAIKGEKIEPTDYFTFIIRSGNLERIKSKRSLFEEKKKGDLVEIAIKKGLWGYELFVIE